MTLSPSISFSGLQLLSVPPRSLHSLGLMGTMLTTGAVTLISPIPGNKIVTERPLEQLGLWGDRWHPAYAFENRTQALAFRRVHVFHKGYAALQVRAELRVCLPVLTLRTETDTIGQNRF